MLIDELRFQILGPVSVEREGTAVPLGGPRQRIVLALLVLNAGRVVPAERLVADIWGGAAPSTGTGPLRTYVSQLRHLLRVDDADRAGGAHRAPASRRARTETSPLTRRPSGYLLDVTGDQVDATVFESRFADARSAVAAGQPASALAAVDEALALWRGPALGDLAGHPALQGDAVRLDQLRLSALELRAEMLVATGQHGQAAAELGALASANPLRERLWALLMTALYRSGRQSDALRCFQEARAHLVDQLGIEPGAELRELERAILRQDPALDARPADARPALGPVSVSEVLTLVPRPDPGHGAAAQGDADARPGSDAVDAARAAGRGTVVRPAHEHDLPSPLTSFVGRVAERAMVADALTESRLVTLCGSGGCGKTRLAIAVAGDLVERFPDGIRFVDLSALSAPDLVVKAVAASYGAETDRPDQLGHLCRTVGDGRSLLVLDNCEHVLDTAAEVADELLSRCPSVGILATSREELRLGAELVRRVEPLPLPDPGALGRDPAALLGSEAVQLFLDRARSALAGFAPVGRTLDTVARICQRLDGLPLAVELAAALVSSLPVPEIEARLDDRFRLLDVAPRRVPSRQRTLRAALDWSFDLLDPPERDLLLRLGVFVGDFTLAAAEAVAGDGGDHQGDDAAGPLDVVHSLRHLVSASMVVCVTSSGGADRYRLLETVRHYARARLEQDRPDVGPEVHRSHARYDASFAVQAPRHVHARMLRAAGPGGGRAPQPASRHGLGVRRR